MISEYYSRRAKDYDSQKMRTWKSREGLAAEILDEVLSALAGLKGKRVLEVGVGSGRIGLPLLATVKPWFVGLDLSREMLRLAKTKMLEGNGIFELVLGDAEHLPFANGAFDALVCVSTTHYFDSAEKVLTGFLEVLKEKGLVVYGDLSLHEHDIHGFMDLLEKTLSLAHARYYKPSEMKQILENHGFHVSKLKVISYKKTFSALMEDKGKYFNAKPETLAEVLKGATAEERKLYSIDSEGLTLFFTLIVTLRESKH